MISHSPESSFEPQSYPRVLMFNINNHQGYGEYVDEIINAANADPDNAELNRLRAIHSERYKQFVGVEVENRHTVYSQAERQVNQAAA